MRLAVIVALVALLGGAARADQIAGSPKEEKQGATTTTLEVVHYGKFRIAPAGDEACLNVRLYSSTPTVEDGDWWVEHFGATHKFCFRGGGVNFCRNAVAQ